MSTIINRLLGENDEPTWKVVFNVARWQGAYPQFSLIVGGATEESAILKAGSSTAFYRWCQDSDMFPDSAPVGEQLSRVKRTLTHSVLHGYSIDREPTYVPGDVMTLLQDLDPPAGSSQLWTAHVSWHAWSDGPDEIDSTGLLIQATPTNEAPSELTPVPLDYYEDFSRASGDDHEYEE